MTIRGLFRLRWDQRLRWYCQAERRHGPIDPIQVGLYSENVLAIVFYEINGIVALRGNTKESKEMKTRTIKLDEQVENRLRELGEKMACSPHWLMKTAIDKYITEQDNLLGAARGRFGLLEQLSHDRLCDIS